MAERQREGYDFVLKENEELKKTLQARKDANANQVIKQDQIKVNILSAQADADKLSQRIVQSPERVRADLDRAKNRIMSLKSSVSERQTRLTELQRQEAACNARQQHTEKSLRLLRDISNDSERLAELEKETSKQQDKRQDLRSESLNLTARLDNQRQVLATRHDKLSKSDLQYHARKAGMQEQITQLSHMKESLRDPEGSCASEKVRLTAEKEQVIEDSQRQHQELEKAVEHADNIYFEIIQQVDKMNVGVANGISKFRGIMKK
nr:hypothetical protein BaRGS_027688 [Batillaria attramentaria]